MKYARKRGMTLVEIMVVVSILAILVSLSLPVYAKYRNSARVIVVANDLRLFAHAFKSYQMKRGKYPPDAETGVLPNVLMGAYLPPARFEAQLVFGGKYDWEGPSWGEGGPYDYAGIAIVDAPVSLEVLEDLDRVLDNGDLTTGKFRQMSNGKYTYVIEESDPEAPPGP